MSRILRTVRIDISKDWLDAFTAPEGRASRFSNDSVGFRKLIAWIGSGVDRIAYEPSGPFHRDLEETLLKAGLPLYAINPFQVRSFARSLGRRAKTDAVDARMLATMAAAIEDLRPAEARSEGQRDLAELQQIRDALRKDRIATTNRGRHFAHSREALERRAEILTSIPGISDITAAGLIVHMPELGTLTGARAASLAGLAPITRESGYWKGRPQLHPGRQEPGPPAALHARASRGPAQSRPQAQVRGACGKGETTEGRPDGRDAEASRPRQHAAAAGPHLDGECTPSGRMSAMRSTADGRIRLRRLIDPGKCDMATATARITPQGKSMPRLPRTRQQGIHLTWILPIPPETLGAGRPRLRPARQLAPARAAGYRRIPWSTVK